ncbi:hypothetical protein DV737_g3505, partial [Chaetothyriales sp. CBS 132003]
MAAPARLSPAASLLRGSKLFALPAAIPLPPSKPSAEPTAASDTATTIYPTRAALVTPRTSLLRGDWGLKRALPLRSTTDTSTPSIRLPTDIDSEGHVTDFESAADHVQTVAKWQEVHFQVKNQPSWVADRRMSSRLDGGGPSVFHAGLDNTTVKSEGALQRAQSAEARETAIEGPEHLREAFNQFRSDREAHALGAAQPLPPPPKPQPPKKVDAKRWRYAGPWLAGLSELEFEAYLRQLDKQKIAVFEDHLKAKIRVRKERESAGKADNGTVALPQIEVTEQDLKDEMRTLRHSPSTFGPEIADFLDLPDGPANAPVFTSRSEARWSQRSTPTVASLSYRIVGPPRTHPSAGFSYVTSNQYAKNSAQYGPQLPTYHLPTRHLKDRRGRDDGQQVLGIGGFVARNTSSGYHDVAEWWPRKNGPKLVADLKEITVAQDGSIELEAQRNLDWTLQNNVPISKQERYAQQTARAVESMPAAPKTMQRLDEHARQSRARGDGRDPKVPTDETEELFRELNAMTARRRA